MARTELPTTGGTRAPVVEAPVGAAQVPYLDELAAGSSDVSIVLAWRIRGPLHERAVALALERLAARHEALRTTIAQRGTARSLLIADPRPVRVEIEQLPPDGGTVEDRMEAAVRACADRGFELSSASLWRATLLRAADADRLLVLVVHHAIVDGVGGHVLARELVELLAAQLEAREPTLSPPVVQPGDVHERERLDVTERRSHWRSRLVARGAPRWPREGRLAPAGPTQLAAEPLPLLPAAFGARLQAVARGAGVSIAMLLAAAAAVSLSAADMPERLWLGVVYDGRLDPRTRDLVGSLADMLPVPLPLDWEAPLPTVLARLRSEWLDAFEHALPLATLQEVARDAAGVHVALADATVNVMQARDDVSSATVIDAASGRVEIASFARMPMRPMRVLANERMVPLCYDAELHADASVAGAVYCDPRQVPAELVGGLGARWWELLARIVAQPDATPTELTAGRRSSS